jgi:hypothetical protein
LRPPIPEGVAVYRLNIGAMRFRAPKALEQHESFFVCQLESDNAGFKAIKS